MPAFASASCGFWGVEGSHKTKPQNKTNKTESNKTESSIMKEYTKEQIWDYILENGIATDDELILITSINGMNEDSLNDVLYARTGYRSVEQMEDCT